MDSFSSPCLFLRSNRIGTYFSFKFQGKDPLLIHRCHEALLPAGHLHGQCQLLTYLQNTQCRHQLVSRPSPHFRLKSACRTYQHQQFDDTKNVRFISGTVRGTHLLLPRAEHSIPNLQTSGGVLVFSRSLQAPGLTHVEGSCMDKFRQSYSNTLGLYRSSSLASFLSPIFLLPARVGEVADALEFLNLSVYYTTSSLSLLSTPHPQTQCSILYSCYPVHHLHLRKYVLPFKLHLSIC